MGLAFHAWPNAENTRASHSLGVAYWATGYLAALSRASDPPTERILGRVRAELNGLSLDLVVRLVALLHDIDLLPLGHTLRYQSGAFAEAEGRPRLAACLAAIKASAPDGAFTDASSDAERGRWRSALGAHLDAAASALAGGPSEVARLVNELVNSGLGADLLDFALRDSAAIIRRQRRHDALSDHLRLVETADGPRLALDLGDGDEAAGRVAAADDLFRARFEIFAASIHHPTKLAADAMLDLLLRRLGPARCRSLLPEARILAMGDDELVDALAQADDEVARAECAAPVGRWLRNGLLHQEVWRSEDLVAFRTRPDAGEALSLDPAWRFAAERRLRERLPWSADGDVIVAISPPAMHVKPADARFRAKTEVFSLAEAGDRGYRVEAPEVLRGYSRLWSLRVCLSARSLGRRDAVRAAAGDLFAAGDARS
jgi:HD superfamily phosphohydrolase